MEKGLLIAINRIQIQVCVYLIYVNTVFILFL